MAAIRRELIDFANQPNMVGLYEDEIENVKEILD